MKKVRRAVIDVGTNSVKLLVADVCGDAVTPIHEESRQTRLGQGFYETHRLQLGPIAHTAEAVREFTETARKHRVKSIRVIATSAARDAVNPKDLTLSIERASGLVTEIISGEREAEWAFQGVTSDAVLAKKTLLLLDVGGGSTEFIVGQGKQKSFARSFPLGTVRLLEKFPLSDPPTRGELAKCRNWLKNFLKQAVRPQMESVLAETAGEIQLVGTGGTMSILARVEKKLSGFDRENIEGVTLSLAQVVAQRKKLWRLPLAERKEIPGLPKNRADVILPGVLIFEMLMQEFGFAAVRVSTRGLRFAAVMRE